MNKDIVLVELTWMEENGDVKGEFTLGPQERKTLVMPSNKWHNFQMIKDKENTTCK